MKLLRLKLWQTATEMPRGFLLVCLSLELLVSLVIVCAGHFGVPLPQFQLGAQELVTSHHIASTFLPIGYPILLGAAEAFGGRWGMPGQHAMVYGLHIGLLLLTTVLLRSLLRLTMPAPWATLCAFVISMHPELLQKLKEVSDLGVTVLLLLFVLLTYVRLREDAGWRNMSWAAIALGLGVLVRPNFVLLFVMVVWAAWPQPWGTRIKLILATSAGSILLYMAVTAAVHGRPFFPQNGPYNLYAGANPRTEQALITRLNGEDSIPLDMRDRGYDVPVKWTRPSDIPGVPDERDLSFAPMYKHWAYDYIRHHPWHMVELSGWKLINLLRPEYKRFGFGDPLTWKSAPWLALKTVEALIVPAWLGLLLCSLRGRLRLASPVVLLLAFLYCAPFILINSDPRFRIPLDVLLLMDIARMLFLWRRPEQAGAGWDVPDRAREVLYLADSGYNNPRLPSSIQDTPA